MLAPDFPLSVLVWQAGDVDALRAGVDLAAALPAEAVVAAACALGDEDRAALLLGGDAGAAQHNPGEHDASMTSSVQEQLARDGQGRTLPRASQMDTYVCSCPACQCLFVPLQIVAWRCKTRKRLLTRSKPAFPSAKVCWLPRRAAR